MTIFGSFEIGRKALRAQHLGMAVSGQNVANANSPGYSRQRADLAAVAPLAVPGAQFAPGQGVVVNEIVRVRSEFYHSQMMSTASHQEYWQTRRDSYHLAEVIFMEPEEFGLNQYLSDFFDQWQQLASSPENMAMRAGLREMAVSMTDTVRVLYLRLEDLKTNLQSELNLRAGELNRLAGVAADLNSKIGFISAMGQSTNELLDQLDLALEDLSHLADLRVYRQANGTVDLWAGGELIVQGEQSFPLRTEADPLTGQLQLLSAQGNPLALQSGRLRGLLAGINSDLPELQQNLDRLVTTLVEAVNGLHRQGYTLDGEVGGDFFNPIAAGGAPAALQFALSDPLLADSRRLAAASAPGQPGNGENALNIARLRADRAVGLDGAAIPDYYRGLITSLGVSGQESERMLQAYSRAEERFRELHLSVSGVNLDEEMLNMIQYQHAWHSAARFLDHVDQLLAVLFHELGD